MMGEDNDVVEVEMKVGALFLFQTHDGKHV